MRFKERRETQRNFNTDGLHSEQDVMLPLNHLQSAGPTYGLKNT
jgi:hypothetical protein